MRRAGPAAVARITQAVAAANRNDIGGRSTGAAPGLIDRFAGGTRPTAHDNTISVQAADSEEYRARRLKYPVANTQVEFSTFLNTVARTLPT